MQAKALQAKTIDELASLLHDSTQDGFTPTLAITFSSLNEEWTKLQALMNEFQIALFGASSNGEFISEQYELESIAMLLLDVNPAFFKIEIADVDDKNIKDVAGMVGASGKTTFNRPAFIISASHTSIKAEDIVEGLLEACGKDVTIIGGNSASESMLGGFVFDNQSRSDKGLLALIIDEDKIALEGEAISGWKPVGTVKTVTNADGNWIKTLDNKPALDFLIRYIGTDIDFTDEDDLYNKIGSIYPIQILHSDGTSHILPPLFFNQSEGSFMLAGPVQKGTRIRFSLPPDFEVVESVVESARARKNLPNAEADALIIFSCAGRLNCLGPMVSDEIEGLIDVWKVPSIGFFTFGEYGSVKNGQPMFHGTTVSWVAMKEK
jgi:hypothetical protein